MPTYHDLLGKWVSKGKKDEEFVFLDESHTTHKQNENINELTYRVDFTKQPIAIDICYANGILLQAFSEFEADNRFWIELFPKNNRGTRTAVFNPNANYLRQTNVYYKNR